MIILDTSILRSFSPESSTADLLRTIRTACNEGIAAPWMVMEELAAQQAIKYQELHDRAKQAVGALRQASPWDLEVEVGLCDPERVREHWRHTWGLFLGTIPTSDDALRQALFREANLLPPCKETKGQKTGSRDAAIWLSAVQYGQEHPHETVYFVSANTKDFGDGTSYPYPMEQDIAGVADRFVHLTSLDQVASRFTEPTEADEALIMEILTSGTVRMGIAETAETTFSLGADQAFECTIPLPGGRPVVATASAWLTTRAHFGSVQDIQAYRIGDHEWCTASVEWHISGIVSTEGLGVSSGAVSWPTAVLFSANREDPSLTVLRWAPPRPVSEDVLGTLGMRVIDPERAAKSVAAMKNAAKAILKVLLLESDRGLPRTDQKEMIRQASHEQMQMGETSPG